MHLTYARNEAAAAEEAKAGAIGAEAGSAASEAGAASGGFFSSLKSQLGLPQTALSPPALQVWEPIPLKTLLGKETREALPAPPDASWTLLDQTYAYSWRASSEKKDLRFSLDDRLLTSEDLVLLLTVSAVPFDAYPTPRSAVSFASSGPPGPSEEEARLGVCSRPSAPSPLCV